MASAPPDTPAGPALEQLIDEVPVGLMVTDTQGGILQVNATLCSWVGHAADELVGCRKLQDLFTVGGRIFHQTHWMPILQIQGSISEVKFELCHGDGRRLTVMLNAVRRQADGNAYDVVSVTMAEERNKYERQLLLERKRADELAQREVRAQEVLQLAQAQLRQAVTELARKSADAEDRALFAEQMVGIVSHDLRNPLSAIMMGTALMARDGTLSARHKKVLDNVDRSSQRAKRLIDELLDFTLVRVGHGLAVSRQAMNFHELVGRCVEELKLTFPSHPILHAAQGSADCFPDPDRIAQLLGNLVANAVTYGQPGGAITVTSLGDDDDCTLKVHNFGEPVPAELRERIFEPLIRGGTPTDQSVRSVGLGLFIVKAIAQAHRGTVNVMSSRDEGTTFTFVFRRDRCDD